ncbi:hypothetical protein HaLaN_09526, partial [Haematococcus lacustris]
TPMPAGEDGDEGSELDMQELNATGGLSYREDVGQAMKPWVAKPARPTGIGRDTSDLDEAAAEAVPTSLLEDECEGSVASSRAAAAALDTIFTPPEVRGDRTCGL